MSVRLDPAKPGPACARCGTIKHHTGSRWRCSKCYNEWQTRRRENMEPARRRAELDRANELRLIERAGWSAEKREVARATSRAWREKNAEWHRQNARDWYAANIDQARAKKLAEYHANPEPFLARNFLRKARMLEQVCEHGGECVDSDFLTTVYAAHCTYCGAPAEHADHFNPLARGGLHCRENIVPACDPCNRSKHARDPIEWLESRTA